MVCAAYDAMTEDRPYRRGLSSHEAREELLRHRGTQFFPEVVDAFVALLAAGTLDAVGFGHQYISNPDLVERVRAGVPLAQPDQSTFYSPGAKGYTDYPTMQ